MNDSFDGLEFAWYLRRHWRKSAICCGTAVLLTLAGSLLLPRRYTATATVVIEPPGSMDPRSGTAVSPVYLESLKTFELMASSDSLFLAALDHLHLRERYPGKSIESLKRSILEVTKPVNTRLIHISATVGGAKEAQALAQYLAERTVALSQSLNASASAGAVEESQSVFDQAGMRVNAARQAMDAFMAKQADGAASSELESASDLKYQAERDLNQADEELAGLLSQQPASGSGAPAWLTTEISAARARIAALNQQDRMLRRTVADAGKRMERVKELRDSLDAELESARIGYDAARIKLDDMRSSAAVRGERLQVLDPGIVPQRPSSPNIVLNILVALLVSLLASAGWLAARFGYERAQLGHREREYQLR